MKKILLLCLTALSFYSYSQRFEVETILESGDSDKKINYAILADGYQAHELDKFIDDCTSFVNTMFQQPPFKQYKNFFNIYAVKVISNDSGAKHPGNGRDVREPTFPTSNPDNYFGSTFDYGGIHRLLVPTRSSAISNVLSENVPQYDQAIVLVNSPYYGGSGGWLATSSTERNANEIVIHELGHSFSKLADEYYAGDGFASEQINMTNNTDPYSVKWKNWIDKKGIGIYQHCCGGRASNWFRPHQNCKMRYLGASFCAVCMQGTVKRIHKLSDFINSYSPKTSDYEVVDVNPDTEFSIDVTEPNPNTLEVEWKIDNKSLRNDEYSQMFSANELTEGEHKLQVTIYDNSPFIKIDGYLTTHYETVTWTIKQDKTLTIGDITSNKFDITLYPNPAENDLFIEQNLNQNFELTLANSLGSEVIKKNFDKSDNKIKISLAKLASGVYYATFKYENGVTVTKKVIKK